VIVGTSGSSGTGTSGSADAGTPAKHAKKASPPVRLLDEVFKPDALPASPSANPVRAIVAVATVPAPLRHMAQDARSAGSSLSAQLSDMFNGGGSDNSWGGLGSAAPRFAPWIVLLIVAWLVRTVAASVLVDRTNGPRRRRWTLL
jgi:hypothetical protein